jgi:ATP-binding cassette subfamily B protein
LITLLLAGVNAAEPLILKYLFDGLASHPEKHVLVMGIGGLLGLGVFRELASGLTNWLTWQTRLGIHYSLLESLVERAPSHAAELPATLGFGTELPKKSSDHSA